MNLNALEKELRRYLETNSQYLKEFIPMIKVYWQMFLASRDLRPEIDYEDFTD